MAIDHFLLEKGELIPEAYACFLVNQVALVEQQAKAIRKHSVIGDYWWHRKVEP